MNQNVTPTVTGDAALQTAIGMEELGRDFYEAVAVATEKPKVRELCLKLAAAEANHRAIFQRMRSELARQGKTVLLADGQLAEARQAAKAAVVPDPETIRRMAVQGDDRALLDLGAEMEKDSIAFYRGFANRAPDRGVIDAIIREEQEHLRLLTAAGAA